MHQLLQVCIRRNCADLWLASIPGAWPDSSCTPAVTAGTGEVQFELAECANTDALRAKLLSNYAELEQLLPQCAFACNNGNIAALLHMHRVEPLT